MPPSRATSRYPGYGGIGWMVAVAPGALRLGATPAPESTKRDCNWLVTVAVTLTVTVTFSDVAPAGYATAPIETAPGAENRGWIVEKSGSSIVTWKVRLWRPVEGNS